MATTSYQRGEKLDRNFFCNAWIAPDGAMYYAESQTDAKHDDTASQLCYDLFGIDQDFAGDVLIDRGWIELSTGRPHTAWSDAIPFECMTDSITQAQLDTLFDVLADLRSRPYESLPGTSKRALVDLERLLISK